MKISQTVFELQSGHDFVTDRQTDGQTTRAKTICLPTLRGKHNYPLTISKYTPYLFFCKIGTNRCEQTMQTQIRQPLHCLPFLLYLLDTLHILSFKQINYWYSPVITEIIYDVLIIRFFMVVLKFSGIICYY